MNDFFQHLTQLHPIWVYIIIFSVAYIENIFPPSPSDVIIVFSGALASMNRGNVYIALVACTVGSTLGFITMYYIGAWFGTHIIEHKSWKYLPRESIHKVEQWFGKYGYLIIIINRFLSGTRAVVSFFAGISNLEIFTTTWLSFVSSFAWYAILIYSGYALGNHWQVIEKILETYSTVISGIIIGALLIGLIWYILKKVKTVKV
ncbi:MAG: DedA family protein [Bacteroidota bacterium]